MAAIGDLVDFSKLSGGVVLHKTQFRLRAALAELVTRVASTAEETRLPPAHQGRAGRLRCARGRRRAPAAGPEEPARQRLRAPARRRDHAADHARVRDRVGHPALVQRRRPRAPRAAGRVAQSADAGMGVARREVHGDRDGRQARHRHARRRRRALRVHDRIPGAAHAARAARAPPTPRSWDSRCSSSPATREQRLRSRTCCAAGA